MLNNNKKWNPPPQRLHTVSPTIIYEEVNREDIVGHCGRRHFSRLCRDSTLAHCSNICPAAARETGARQAAKTKLEKQVEELTWHLQLEKRIRADIVETKTQENEKLQAALQEMQQKFDETKALLVKEREAAEVAGKEVFVIKEIPVIDTALLDKLRAENEKLKALVISLETKIDETEKKYEESIITSEQRLKKAMEAESKIVDLNHAMNRKSLKNMLKKLKRYQIRLLMRTN